MTVLKVKGIKELLRALGTDFSQRLAHRKSGPGVFGHGEGQYLGVGSVDGKDIGLVPGTGGEKSFTGH